MESRRRFTITPATAISILALFFALGGSALAVGKGAGGLLAAQPRCANGAVRGIASVSGPAGAGMANLPDRFTSSASLFSRRFNCTGKATQARRVETGVFEVRFVGVSGASAVASAPGDSLVSVEPSAGGAFKVTIHPAGRDDRVDLPFTIVVV